jgi:hypothetical protein
MHGLASHREGKSKNFSLPLRPPSKRGLIYGSVSKLYTIQNRVYKNEIDGIRTRNFRRDRAVL